MRRRQANRAGDNHADARGSDREFTTYECVVFKLDAGRIKEQATYVNWLDAYVQAGLIDLAPLLD